MKQLVLITASFPFGEREPFLETEVKYYEDVKVRIVPLLLDIKQRKLPLAMELDLSIAKRVKNGIGGRFYYLLKSLRHKLFYKELFRKSKSLKSFVLAMSRYEMFYTLFDEYLNKIDNTNDMIFYTYWHNEATYALQSLKEKYGFTLVSRIHRGDLYQETKRFNYMPLKGYFLENIDKIYTITPSANDYLMQTYRFNKNNLELSRLGVQDNKINSSTSDKDSFNIVSCSIMNEVKQVDKIIKALSSLADIKKKTHFKWTHIGDGPMLEVWRNFAEEKLQGLPNVEFYFLGSLENIKVYEFYRQNKVDVFVNVSASEGVPVSIMEAMSCHIPIIASNVGGIKDMINDGISGVLLSEYLTDEELINALTKIEFFKSKDVRDNAYMLYKERYCAETNYSNFIKKLASL